MKTIVLPSVWRDPESRGTLTEEEYFKLTGVKLSDIFFEAGRADRNPKLVPAENTFLLLEITLGTEVDGNYYTLFAPTSIESLKNKDDDLILQLYVYKNGDSEYARIAIKKDRLGAFSITYEEI